MLLLDHGDSAAATGDNYLICGCQRTDGFDLYDIDRLGGSNNTAEALAVIDPCDLAVGIHRALDIIALLYFNLSIFLGHVTTNDFGGLIESLIIRIYRDLGEDGADRLGDPAVQKLGTKRVLDIIAYITLAHSRTDTHRCGGIVDVHTA